MYAIIIKLIAAIACLIGLYFFGYKAGKSKQNLENIKKVMKSAEKAKKNEFKHAGDTISVARKWMRKYTRDR